MLEKNAMEKHDNSVRTKSLFAFCGSAVIAKQLMQAKDTLESIKGVQETVHKVLTAHQMQGITGNDTSF